MSNKPHYFAIGLFVMVASAIGLMGVVAFSSDALRSPKYFLETYVDESVQGIDVGTPFKFRGVKIGNISEISMVSSVYDTTKMYVLIRVALDEKEMLHDMERIPDRVQKQIENGLRMKLVPQGITGLSFLEAEYYPDTKADPLEIDWKPKYTYIPSTPAMMTLVSRSLERLSSEIDSLDLTAIGDHVEAVTRNLNRSVQHLEHIMHHAAGVSDEIIENVRLAASDLPTVTSNLNDTVVSLEDLVNESDRNVEQILTNLRYITDDTRELIRRLKRHPGMLLSEPPKKNLSRGGKDK